MKDAIIYSIAIIIILIALSQHANAATSVQRYVNTDCANNGNGTLSTCGSTGANGAYRTLGEGYADIASDYPDFVSADVIVTVDCAGTTVDSYNTGNYSIIDYTVTVDSTRYLIIQAATGNAATAIWNTSKYRISGAYYDAIFKIRRPFFKIQNIQMENVKTGAGPGTPADGFRFDFTGTAGKISIIGNLIRYAGDYTNQDANAVRDWGSETSGVTKVFTNNVIVNWRGAMQVIPAVNSSVYAYNNTCYSNVGSGICFMFRGNTGATTTAKNNLANGSVQGYDISVSSTWTHNNNLSEDTSSPDDTYDSKAVTFVNEGGGDYHLASGDTNAKNNGADLSGATEGFSVDIDQQTRSGTWDIGADEEQSSAAYFRLKTFGNGFFRGFQQ